MGVGVGVGVGSGMRTRSRAPAQHCVHACYLAHTRSRATDGVGCWGGVGGGGGVGVGWGGAQPLTRTRPALHPRLPPSSHAAQMPAT